MSERSLAYSGVVYDNFFRSGSHKFFEMGVIVVQKEVKTSLDEAPHLFSGDQTDRGETAVDDTEVDLATHRLDNMAAYRSSIDCHKGRVELSFEEE